MDDSASNPVDSEMAASQQEDESVLYRPPGSTDPAWKYGFLADKHVPNIVTCLLCRKVCRGGINRLKQHLAHIKGNVSSCPNVDKDTRQMIRSYLEDINKKKQEKAKAIEEVREGVNIMGDKEDVGSNTDGGSKKQKVSTENSIELRQPGIKEVMDKESRKLCCGYVARWAYRNGIPFNAICNDDFLAMGEAIGKYGRNFKPPTMHKLREPLLKMEVEKTKEGLQSHRDAWKKYGCSIMTDAWSDKRGRSIMNLCVNCEKGTSFLRALDVSESSHTGEFICDFVEDCIKEVGAENVVQIVTDNASNNMLAKRLLKEKYPKIFWTSCAAHTIDLMCEEIGKDTRIKSAIKKAKDLTLFIYSHTKTLSLMRQFTKKGEIVRPGETRFATSFLALESIWELRGKLKNMFASDEWTKSRWPKTKKGHEAEVIVYSQTFWNHVSFALKIFQPLVHLLRVVDGERRPSMGFVYGGLEDVKREIKAIFNNMEISYKPFINAINIKGKDRVDTCLHVAAYFLNPYYYHKDSTGIAFDGHLMEGLVECVEIFYPDLEIQEKILKIELIAYMEA